MKVKIEIEVSAGVGAAAFASQVWDAIPTRVMIADYRKRIIGAILPVKFNLPKVTTNPHVTASITFDN